jgi:hypothetical protein
MSDKLDKARAAFAAALAASTIGLVALKETEPKPINVELPGSKYVPNFDADAPPTNIDERLPDIPNPYLA